MTGRRRFLEGDGQWERTEGRSEAGGSNSNHTDEACSPCMHGTWSMTSSGIHPYGNGRVSVILTSLPLKWPRAGCPCRVLASGCGGVVEGINAF